MGADTGIEAAPELERLRSLLFTDERERVAELERKVAQFEALTSSTSAVLPEIFNLSYLETVRDRLVESMGPPVVDAAARMATQQTQRTAKALAPVMLPAIVAGVAREIEKISRRAGNASPLAKMHWKRESSRTGIPVAILASRDASPTQVVEAWIFDCRSGELIAHEQPADSIAAGVDPDAAAALMSAMRSFAVQHGLSPESGTVQRLDTGERTLWIITDGEIALAADLLGTSAETSDILQAEFEYLHVSHKLNMPIEHMTDWLRRWVAATHNRLRKKQSSARWSRALLAVIVAALVAWLAAFWYTERVATAIESRLVETPGVASASVRSSWQWLATDGQRWGPNWRVNVSSDPSVKPIMLVAQAYPALADRFAIRQQKFLSVDRDAIASRLADSLSGERDLVVQWVGAQVKLAGVVSYAGMAQLQAWPWALLGLADPDVSMLSVAPREGVRSAPVLDPKLPGAERTK